MADSNSIRKENLHTRAILASGKHNVAPIKDAQSKITRKAFVPMMAKSGEMTDPARI